MRLSEVFLRIGSSLAAWMVIYAYFIWVAVTRRVECGVDGDEIFRLLLGMAPVAFGAAFLLKLTRPFDDIHRILRWLGVPVLALLLLTVPTIWQVFVQVNLEGGAICLAGQPAGWHQVWSPLQMIVSVICVWQILSLWRSAPYEEKDGLTGER